MKRRAIMNLSTEILLRYYDNDVSMFLEYLDDHVLWYGPAERQFLRGKEAMAAAWASENNPLTFTTGNLKTELISPGPSLLELHPICCHPIRHRAFSRWVG